MIPLIEISDLFKDYKMGTNTVTVLKGIQLIINKNEYVALMGPSGSGKSTLMNILGCLDTPTSGKYILNHIDVSSMQMMPWRAFEIKRSDLCFNNLIYCLV